MVQQRTPLWLGFHNALSKNFVIQVNNSAMYND